MKIECKDDLREIARRVAVNFGEDTAERAVVDVLCLSCSSVCDGLSVFV